MSITDKLVKVHVELTDVVRYRATIRVTEQQYREFLTDLAARRPYVHDAIAELCEDDIAEYDSSGMHVEEFVRG